MERKLLHKQIDTWLIMLEKGIKIFSMLTNLQLPNETQTKTQIIGMWTKPKLGRNLNHQYKTLSESG